MSCESWALRVVRASEHGLPFQSPVNADSWRVEGYGHLVEIEWKMESQIPSAWESPAVMEAPASRAEILRRHPKARPFCRLAVGQLRLGGGQIVAPMHSGFSPLTADWRDTEGVSVRGSLSGHSLLRSLGETQLRAWKPRTVEA